MDFDRMLETNPLCQRLGIRYPILQAGMFQVAMARLASAVSEAGGLGVIGSAFMSPEDLREQIRLVKDHTSAPFGVDILFARTPGSDAASTGYTRQVQDHIEVVFEEGVPVLVSGLGNPVEVVPRAHDAGMTVLSLVGNVRQAKRLAGDGVDFIIASGSDGGGHVGRVGTAALVPAVVDALQVPVLAAGGLADGRGLVAALAFGACGVWMGTRFISTVEARGHDNYKQKIVEIDDEGTVISRANSGKPVRMIRNRFTESWEGREADILPFPQQMIEVGQPASVAGRIEGDVENGVLPAGQSSALIHEIKPAGQVVRDIVAEARAVFARW
ncbi:MAG: nitronate monooxygenase [SAR324 cluster bacterium]|nr:nitronate monooxygenase [SAR324 cluster bacterium]MCZ6559093.1 nitronate monooxygenase [SAR324 cluster bacterium]